MEFPILTLTLIFLIYYYLLFHLLFHLRTNYFDLSSKHTYRAIDKEQIQRHRSHELNKSMRRRSERQFHPERAKRLLQPKSNNSGRNRRSKQNEREDNEKRQNRNECRGKKGKKESTFDVVVSHSDGTLANWRRNKGEGKKRIMSQLFPITAIKRISPRGKLLRRESQRSLVRRQEEWQTVETRGIFPVGRIRVTEGCRPTEKSKRKIQ